MIRCCRLSWPGWCPGGGHLYQGRTGKAILYAVCILGLYLMGMVMGEGKIVYWRWVNPFNNPEKFCIYYLGQFWVGLAALPALDPGDIAVFRPRSDSGGFLAEPSQAVLNGLHPRLGKLVEIGTIYTTVAGLLNILAIYDAYEGPAYQEYEEEHPAPVSPECARGGRRSEGGRLGVIMAQVQVYWLVLPLVAAISVVYSASRHESWPRIWSHSIRLGLWILGLLVAATAALLLINTQV